MRIDSEYVPEILTRLIREGFEIKKHYSLAEIGQGVLTLGEVKEDLDYWKQRISEFYKGLGWNPGLIDILNNN